MSSSHKITGRSFTNPKWKTRFRIQIGSFYLFSRLVSFGFTVNKSLTIKFPKVPSFYLSHFVRGYFDGDGFVAQYSYPRKNRGGRIYTYYQSGFTSGSKIFLDTLYKLLQIHGVVNGGTMFIKKGGWELRFSGKDTIRLCHWM